MIIIQEPVNIREIQANHNHFFTSMVKIVVDVEREVVAIDADLHADLEELLLEDESSQENLWGANLYFLKPYDLEFTSLINIRPHQNNRGMEVTDERIRSKMTNIVKKLILT